MNIWIQVVQHLQPGGIETMALDLQRMEERGERGIIVSLEGDKEQALKAWPRLRPYANRLMFLNKKPGWRISTILKLAKLFRKWAVPVVHTHHIGPLIYGGIAARLAGVPVVIHTEHDAWHLRQFRRRFLQQRIIDWVNPLLVADADLVAGELRRSMRLDQHQVQVIKNGIDTHYFSPGNAQAARHELGLPKDVRIIGCAGRLELEKGQSTLLDALAYLPSDCHLALAGKGNEYHNLQRQAELLGISERVHFLGCLDDMPNFYRALDVFCLPSLFEGLSLVLLEAQACQIPTVATNVGASSEALCPRSGSLVEPGSAFGLAQALEKTLDNKRSFCPRQFVKQVGDLRTTAKNYSALRHRYLKGG